MSLVIEGNIYLLPASPKDRGVDFRLHVPQQTVIKGRARGGSIVALQVTPSSRCGDVVMKEDQVSTPRRQGRQPMGATAPVREPAPVGR